MSTLDAQRSWECQLKARLARWRGIVRSTQALPREEAREAIGALYRASGRDPPVVVFQSSPLACLAAWRALQALSGGKGQASLAEEVAHKLRRSYRQLFSQERREILRRAIGHGLNGPISALINRLGFQMTGLQMHVQAEMRRSAPQVQDDLWAQLDEARISLDVSQRARVRGVLKTAEASCQERPVPYAFWGAWGCLNEVIEDCLDCLGVRGAEPPGELARAWVGQAQVCHWWLPLSGIALVSERPGVLGLDGRGRLHREDGPALEYSGGPALFAWHGARVDPRIIADPGSIHGAQGAPRRHATRVGGAQSQSPMVL